MRLLSLQDLSGSFQTPGFRQTHGLNVSQRRLVVSGFNVDFHAGTVVEDINDLAAELFADDPSYNDNKFTVQDIAKVIQELAASGEHDLDEYSLRDTILATRAATADEQSTEEQSTEEFDVAPVVENVDGQTVGKRTFPGDSFHITIKPKIISAIGKKELSRLVYKKKGKHNFDFWIGKKGEIWAGGNNSGGHEVKTSFVLTEDNQIEKA